MSEFARHCLEYGVGAAGIMRAAATAGAGCPVGPPGPPGSDGQAGADASS